MRKIYVVGGSNSYANWMQGELVDSLERADLVVFTGGEDVSPYLYGEPTGRSTYTNRERDKEEVKIYRKAIELGKHIIGICRGSQLSCVMAGGVLVQDQANPDYLHPIHTSDGKKVNITSTHHQAQMPYNILKDEYKILAWTEDQSFYHLDGEEKELYTDKEKEVEICFYPKIKALAIQGHPESMWNAKEQFADTFEYLHDLLNKHLTNQL